VTWIALVIEGHDWRERVIYHGADQRHRIERLPEQLECFTCGAVKAVGETIEACQTLYARKLAA